MFNGVNKLFVEAVAFCLGVIDGLPLKVITPFGCEGIFLPLR